MESLADVKISCKHFFTVKFHVTADFQSSQNYLMEFLLLDIADLIFQSSYWISCLTAKNHVAEKTGP